MKDTQEVNIYYEVRMSSDNWTLTITCRRGFVPCDKNDRLYRWGTIEYNTVLLDDPSIFWDNLPAFVSPSKEIKKECKKELKGKGIWKKGMWKELMLLIDAAKSEGYL